MFKKRNISLLLVFLLIFINSLMPVESIPKMIEEPVIIEYKCCEKIGFNDDFVNKTINRDCCANTKNPEVCYQCVLEQKQRIEKERFDRDIVIYSSSAFAILFGISIFAFFIVKRNTLDWKEFYKLKLSKIILFFVVVIIAGFFVLLQAMTYDAPANPISFAIVSFLFCPFLLALFFEKLIFRGVNWFQLRDTPFIIVAFIVNVIWIYSIVCILYYLLRGKK